LRAAELKSPIQGTSDYFNRPNIDNRKPDATKQAADVMTQPELNQDWLEDFEIIRSFHDSEVTEKVATLLDHTGFPEQLKQLFGALSEEDRGVHSIQDFLHSLRQATSIKHLQALESAFLGAVLKSTLSQVETFGLEPTSAKGQIEPHYLFISNHRDIVLDPLILNWVTLENGLSSCHCAIGDNLLVDESGRLIALLNKCFAVLRSIKSPKAMVAAMRTQSAYIRHLRFNALANIWIAQREGRSKDNSDRTNPALIKMLGLAKPKEMPLGEYIKALKLVPISLSYEWDPCDLQKAEELLAIEKGTYKKDGMADLKAVRDGLTGDKGQIQVYFDTQFSDRIPPGATHDDIAQMIDQSIQKNYAFYPVTFAAAALLSNLSGADKHISEAIAQQQQSANCGQPDIDKATIKLEQRLSGASAEIRKRVLTSYAQPILSYIALQSYQA
jgi:hypothetical protein